MTESHSCPVCGSNGSRTWLKAPDRFHGQEKRYQLVRCPGCRLVWLRNAPCTAEMGQHYGPNYDRLITSVGEHSPERWKARSEALSRHASGGALLDLGCSSGAFLASLKKENWRLFGIEMSAQAARRAEARTGAEVFVGDILDAPYAAESFDVITCFDVLEHVYEPRKVLERVCCWLKPGGIFYTLLPNIESGEARLFKSYWYGLELPRHISHFSPDSLRYLAHSVGLEGASVEARRNSALEYSLRYVNDELLQRIGIIRSSLAEAPPARLPWKIVRKMLRWTVFAVIYHATALLGPGESIHAVFQKRA
jgi:2-polyprenyl-3-methyl-5-hydroxy-6-metoxy-1,4-benzoquinol methylase